MPYITEAGAGDVFKKICNLVQNFSDKRESTRSSRNSGYYNGDFKGLQRSSIMKASKDLVMTFPVICSDTLSPSTASMINKAIERNCVTQLQILFSASYMNGNSGQEVLRMWHRNMDANIGLDDVLDISDSIGSMGVPFKEQCQALHDADRFAQEMVNECKLPKKYYEDSLNMESLRSYFVEETWEGYKVKKGLSVVVEAKKANDDEIGDPRYAYSYVPISKAQFDADMKFDERIDSKTKFDYQQRMDNIKLNKDQEKFDYQKKVDDQRLKNDAEKFAYQKDQDFMRAKQQAAQDTLDHFRKQLLDNDVKKCNELVPSMIIVRFHVANAEDTLKTAVEQQFIAGVKARLIPVTSEDIMNHVRTAITTKVNKFNWIRATTGEISFSRDFVLGLDQAKIDAKNNSRLSKSSPIWRSLQSRSTKSALNRLKKNRANDAGAITTLVLTREEVNYLKSNYNIDLLNVKTAQSVMEAYNFMGLVIVDENFEVASFLFDGDLYYDEKAFASLEKESGDGSYKKVINLISKINRG